MALGYLTLWLASSQADALSNLRMLIDYRRLAAGGFKVTIYERRKNLGGLWSFSKQPENAGDSEGRFASAVYDDLHTTGTSEEDNARHLLPYPQFMDYLHRLEKICESAEQRSEDDEMEGNLPFQWTLELEWIRQNRREIREAFMERSKIEQ